MPRAPRDSGLQLVVTVYILSYMFRLVNELQNVPRIRLLERAVCEVYYRKHLTGTSLTDGIPELRCKNPTIQNEVVLIMGWKISLDALPGILTGTYFGVLADKYGRRPVLMLSCLGELLSLLSVMFICYRSDIFPVRLTLLSTFFLMLGGGGRIFSSIIQTLLAEIGEESLRTRRFYQLAAIEMLGNLSAPPIEAWTIPVSVWLPFCITLALYLLVLVTIWFLVPPKVKQRIPIKNQPSPDSSVTQNLLGRPCDGTLPESEENHAFAIPSASTMWEEVWELLKNKTIAMLLFVTFAKRIGFLSEAFFPQYASEFFHMLYSQTPWFSWANYAGSMLSQGVLLPQLTSWLLRQSLEQISIDVGLIEMNLGLLSIGYAAVWLAFSPVLFGIGCFLSGVGEGAEPGIQSLASSFVKPAQYARLYTTLTLAEMAGRIIGGSLMAFLLKNGRTSQGEPRGLVYLLSSTLFLLSLIIICLSNLSKTKDQAIRHAEGNGEGNERSNESLLN